MIIIPEIECVYIRIPNTDTDAFENSILANYKKSYKLFNYMEVDGIPFMYNNYSKIAIIRRPVERIWNYYNDIRSLKEPSNATEEAMIKNAQWDFESWLLNNSICINTPFKQEDTTAAFSIIHRIPENKKSQFFYARPDKGTMLLPYGSIKEIAECFQFEVDVALFKSPYGPPPPLSDLAVYHFHKYFGWDSEMCDALETAMRISKEFQD